MINHFSQKITSPGMSLLIGYIYVGIFMGVLSALGLYDNTTFFNWGTPITFMGTKVESMTTYYVLLLMFFFHQMINNYVSDVTYPWIINCVQDPKSNGIVYSKIRTLMLINLFSIYSEIDMIFIVSGITSQFAFFIVIVVANVFSVSFVNYQYLKNKIDIGYSDIQI